MQLFLGKWMFGIRLRETLNNEFELLQGPASENRSKAFLIYSNFIARLWGSNDL
ncbi:MAG: hypothetical protein U5K56_13495 [Halioglobus sp.]|nr:hypothetical protein [Halioglobus sp.]